MSEVRNKILFHSGPTGSLSGIGDEWRRLDAAGISIGHKCADSYGPLYEILHLPNLHSVTHHLAWRVSTRGQNDGYDWDVPNYYTDPHTAAQMHWDAIKTKIPPEFDKRVWIEPINEVRARVDPDKPMYQNMEPCDWLGLFGVEIATMANAEGYRVALFAWSSGEPEPEGWGEPGMLEYLRYCQVHPDGAAVSLHEYSYNVDDIMDGDGYKIGRFRFLFDMCDSHQIAQPKVLVSEFGWTLDNVPTDVNKGIADIDLVMRTYYKDYDTVLMAGTWNLDGGWKGINDKLKRYIPPLGQFTLDTIYEVDTPPVIPPPIDPPPAGDYKSVVIKIPQEYDTPEQWETVAAYAYDDYKRTQTASHNDAAVMTLSGNSQSYIKVVDPHFPSQVSAIEYFEALGIRWEPLLLGGEVPPTGHPLDGIDFGYIFKVPYVQSGGNAGKFGAPRIYNGQQYQHEGCDYDILTNETNSKAFVICAYPGIVTRSLDSSGGYGKYVVIESINPYNNGRFFLWYAHMDFRFVEVGQSVSLGASVGELGTTGQSTAEHCHLNIQVPGHGVEGNFIVPDVVDPTPHIPVRQSTQPPQPPTGQTYDLYPYLNGDGRIYDVRHASGDTETFQSQTEGDTFYQVKNQQYEKFFADQTYIWRGIDTSPGPAPNGAERPGQNRYYVQFETGYDYARWCKRNMRVGETFTAPVPHGVLFYYKSDCADSTMNSGAATNIITVVAHHNSYTVWKDTQWETTVNDVLELRSPRETYFYAKGYGLIGWGMGDAQSGIFHEFNQGDRGDLVRETGCFS